MIKLIVLVLVVVIVGAEKGDWAQSIIDNFNKLSQTIAKALVEDAQLRNRSVPFVIKHKSSGVFWAPEGGSNKPDDNTNIVTHTSGFKPTVWLFEHYENQWGYIRHNSSGKYVQPHGGSLKPSDWTSLVLHSTKYAACLFALDVNRDFIIHKGGLYAQPLTDQQFANTVFGNKFEPLGYPQDNTNIELHHSINDAMQWQFVDPNDIRKEVRVYGKPKMTGDWKQIFAALNPRVARTYTVTVTIGKSNSTETTSSFTYTWELNTGFSIGSFNFGGSLSVEKMFSTTTSQTWTKETKESRTISVKDGGPSVVVWQYIFHLEQNDHHVEFGSDITADTDSLNRKPDITLSSTASTIG